MKKFYGEEIKIFFFHCIYRSFLKINLVLVSMPLLVFIFNRKNKKKQRSLVDIPANTGVDFPLNKLTLT